MKTKIKMAPFYNKVDGIIEEVRTWYQRNIKKTVLRIRLVGGTKLIISRRF